MDNQREFIFGTRAVLEAVRTGKPIDRILLKKEGRGSVYHELLEEIRKVEIPVQYVPQNRLDYITGKNHQGIIAWLSPIEFHSLTNLLPSIFENGKDPLVMILDGISDVRNFGAIIRSADCMGADAAVIPGKGSARIGADAVKTSAGALLHFPVCREKSIVKAAEFLKNSGLKLVGASEKSGLVIHEADLSGPLAIILGAEDRGISRELESLSDILVGIPMAGQTESLNVSVAAGIFLYEAVRQRTR
ncbi:MAG: 23S rRNA (guanosine(2251)-2'-O)-methyltransferase RlmB [Bacteroidales bacterium]|jgi:23S rRNA (guanosine2251-2'-O)-methyltransferase|nr:23S rRNA (guanosine(2251)-2'-O)-methyltransferase RlmB [Bacteroidales bacterium]